MTWKHSTTAEEAATVLKDHINGKNIVVTGVSPGSLGAETVQVLAPYAKTIIVASRSIERAEKAVIDARKRNPSAEIRVIPLNLMSEKSIRAAGEQIRALGIPIHVLINNAAVAHFKELTRTDEGFEAQIGANHFGHFLFTSLLFPSLLQAKSTSWSPRIVNVSSLAAVFGGPLVLDDMHFKKNPEKYDWSTSYSQSKTANLLFTRELGKRYGTQSVLAFAVHPGIITGTNMGGATPEDWFINKGLLKPDGSQASPEAWKSIAEGTSTQIIAAFDPSLTSSNVDMLNDGVPIDQSVFPLPPFLSSEEDAKRLWEISEEAWGIKFGA